MANVKRSRGRGRKPGNQANRSYESNGPDVKIRGNAAHISEKYQQLARDAAASGDRIAAENYLQHAEHYYRLVLAAQQQNQPDQRGENQNARQNGNGEDAEQAAGEAPAESRNSAPANGDASNDDGGQPRRRSRRRPRDQVTDVDGAPRGEGGSDTKAESKAAGGNGSEAAGPSGEAVAETA